MHRKSQQIAATFGFNQPHTGVTDKPSHINLPTGQIARLFQKKKLFFPMPVFSGFLKDSAWVVPFYHVILQCQLISLFCLVFRCL